MENCVSYETAKNLYWEKETANSYVMINYEWTLEKNNHYSVGRVDSDICYPAPNVSELLEEVKEEMGSLHFDLEDKIWEIYAMGMGILQNEELVELLADYYLKLKEIKDEI